MLSRPVSGPPGMVSLAWGVSPSTPQSLTQATHGAAVGVPRSFGDSLEERGLDRLRRCVADAVFRLDFLRFCPLGGVLPPCFGHGKPPSTRVCVAAAHGCKAFSLVLNPPDPAKIGIFAFFEAGVRPLPQLQHTPGGQRAQGIDVIFYTHIPEKLILPSSPNSTRGWSTNIPPLIYRSPRSISSRLFDGESSTSRTAPLLTYEMYEYDPYGVVQLSASQSSHPSGSSSRAVWSCSQETIIMILLRLVEAHHARALFGRSSHFGLSARPPIIYPARASGVESSESLSR